MTTISFSQHRGQAYRSRLATIVGKELTDYFVRRPTGLLHAILALSIIPAAAFMLDAGYATAIADSNMRTSFPLLLGTMLGAASVLMAFGPSLQDGLNRTLEPVLTTSLRRSEFVLAKFLAVAVIWTAFMASQVVMLGLCATVPFIRSRLAMFGYFHPQPVFWVELLLILVSTWMMFAAGGFLLSTCKRQRQIPIALGTLAVLGALGGKVHALWPLVAVTPYFNLTNGVASLFAEMPYDLRMSAVDHTSILPYHPHIVLITIAASTVMAAIFLWLAVRRFERLGVNETA